MRGLPPPPPDVVQIEAGWTVASLSEVTTSWWLFAPGADVATTAQLETLLGDFFFGPIGDLLVVLGSDVTCGALRLSSFGSAPLRIVEVPAPTSGALEETTALNAAAVMTWRTSDQRTGGRSHTFLPLSEALIDVDRQHLTSIGYSQVQGQARLFAQHVNAITSPDGATCVFVTLHRSLSGIPLHTSVMSPIELGDASPYIGTLRRRIRARRPSSTPF